MENDKREKILEISYYKKTKKKKRRIKRKITNTVKRNTTQNGIIKNHLIPRE